MAQDTFSCYDTISRGTVRRILKNMAFFQEMLQKSQFEEEKQVFSFKMVYQDAQEVLQFLAECCFN